MLWSNQQSEIIRAAFMWVSPEDGANVLVSFGWVGGRRKYFGSVGGKIDNNRGKMEIELTFGWRTGKN